MEGENFVSLVGKIERPSFKTVGQHNSSLFKANLAIPTQDSNNFQYIKIVSWGTLADGMAEVSPGIFVKVHGHIEENSYNGKCRHCGGFDKKYWTNVVVDNFIKMEDE
jgi:single-stranded DNA-binding protein